VKYRLTDYELDWVLAGMRLLAHVVCDPTVRRRFSDLDEIKIIAEERRIPSVKELDRLCMELNTHQRSDAIRPDADDIVERKPGSRLLKCFAVVAGDNGFIITESVSQDSGTAILRFMKREPKFMETGWADAQKLGYRLAEFTFAEMESRTFADS